MPFYLVCTTFVLLLLLQCVSSSVALTEYHRCIHDRITPMVGPPDVDIKASYSPSSGPNEGLFPDGALKKPERINASDGWEHIRIRIFADDLKKEGRYCTPNGQKALNAFDGEVDCTSEDVLTPEKKDILVNTILKEAVQLHSERLYVEPLKGNLVVPRFKAGNICANFTVPEEHYTDGVADADMVLYVAAAPMKFPRSFAWAVTCATLDDKKGRISHPGRPVVGVMNYAPRHILTTSQHVRVAAHEIAHALGFSVNEMMKLQMLKHVNNVRGKGMEQKVSLVSSPNTLRETRWLYNCNTTKGMELEDEVPPWFKMVQGGGGGAGRQFVGQHPARRQQPNGRPDPRGPAGPSGWGMQGRQGLYRGNAHERTPPRPRRGDNGLQGSGEVARVGPQGQRANKLTGITADVQESQCPGGKVCAVEKQREMDRKQYQYSHWKRRNAKDELMAGIVGFGYYTALTMAAFADMDYYMVEWSKEERMSWGNHSGCQLLDEKCVNNSQTQYPDMFCTTKESPLQCTSDRHALGTCLLMNLAEQLAPKTPIVPPPSPKALRPQSPPDLPSQFQYFVEKNMGSPQAAQMDHCPFIAADHDTWCTDGIEEKMPGSIIAPNSRCVKGEELKVKEKNIGDVCVKVSCRNGTVSVKYKGNDEWHVCAEGTKLTVDTTELKGHIVCPKYDDVCNTINRTLDEVEGPPPPKPKPKPETRPETPKANNPTPAAKNPTAPTAQGSTVSTATTTTTTSTLSTQSTATPNKQESVAPNGNTKSATATGKVAAGALDSKKNATTISTNAMPALTSTSMNSGVSIEIPNTDVVAPPAAAALFVPFVCLLLVTTIVAVS